MRNTAGAHQLRVDHLDRHLVAVDFHHGGAEHHIPDTQDQPLTEGWLQVTDRRQSHGLTVGPQDQDREGV